ncbi:N-acetylmuramoyl-L-alanine amidase [Methylobacterium oryzisoli]|uniref:N-acetylmuramoyl-L-alanine amidase n=1 Tax=Methylobacterium oryzisoli TaxID=3385502 RepID=UPI0038915274
MATIVLDPGHGGKHKIGGSSPNNATGPNGLKEKKVTLKVGIAAKKALDGSGHTVILTRDEDENLGIVERAKVAKDNDAAVFISIHFNAPGGSTPAQGTETWIGTGHTAMSRGLADAVQRRVLAVTGYRDRKVKVGNVSGVIKPENHDPDTANCLVEISFLSLQASEEARLGQQSYIDALGQAIADAALEHLGQRGLGVAPAALAQLAVEEPEDGASARRLGFVRDDDDEAGVVAVDADAFRVPFADLDAFERMTESAPDADLGPAARAAGFDAALAESAPAVTIDFGPNAKAADVTAFSRQVLGEVMQRAGLSRVIISSTSRSPADQARVMFNNLERFGIAHQRALYGPAGDLVIGVYQARKAAGAGASAIKAAMEQEIIRIGPTRVSRHASDPKVLNVFDVAPSSVTRKAEFEREVTRDARISKFITPPNDPGYHLEIPQPGAP